MNEVIGLTQLTAAVKVALPELTRPFLFVLYVHDIRRLTSIYIFYLLPNLTSPVFPTKRKAWSLFATGRVWSGIGVAKIGTRKKKRRRFVLIPLVFPIPI